jgi:hypothetical protein
LQFRPSGADRLCVGHADHHAPGIALVRQRRGLGLEHDRITEPIGGGDRLFGRSGEYA